MNLVGVLPFSLSQSAPERISTQRKLMYKNVATGIVGSETETEVAVPNMTIPVGVNTLRIEAKASATAAGTYFNQGILFGLPVGLA